MDVCLDEISILGKLQILSLSSSDLDSSRQLVVGRADVFRALTRPVLIDLHTTQY
jgi:hypothetical protein